MVEPGLVIQPLGELHKGRQVLRAKIQFLLGTSEIEGTILAELAIGIISLMPFSLCASEPELQHVRIAGFGKPRKDLARPEIARIRRSLRDPVRRGESLHYFRWGRSDRKDSIDGLERGRRNVVRMDRDQKEVV